MPIFSADKITRQKSVVCHAKIADNFVGQDSTCSIFDNFVGRLFVYRSTNFVCVAMVMVYNKRWIFMLVIYYVWNLFLFIRCRKKWCTYYFAICILLLR